jgi:hypothetical protein
MNWLTGEQVMRDPDFDRNMRPPEEEWISDNLMGELWFGMSEQISQSLSIQNNGYSFKCLTISQVTTHCRSTHELA